MKIKGGRQPNPVLLSQRTLYTRGTLSLPHNLHSQRVWYGTFHSQRVEVSTLDRSSLTVFTHYSVSIWFPSYIRDLSLILSLTR